MKARSRTAFRGPFLKIFSFCGCSETYFGRDLLQTMPPFLVMDNIQTEEVKSGFIIEDCISLTKGPDVARLTPVMMKVTSSQCEASRNLDTVLGEFKER